MSAVLGSSQEPSPPITGRTRVPARARTEPVLVELDGCQVEVADIVFWAEGGRVFHRGILIDDLTAERLLPHLASWSEPLARELTAAIAEAKRQQHANL